MGRARIVPGLCARLAGRHRAHRLDPGCLVGVCWYVPLAEGRENVRMGIPCRDRSLHAPLAVRAAASGSSIETAGKSRSANAWILA